ncbi:anti-sigma factor [Kineosporia mesophila]|uniref:Regulator of SigK n=1 Tax=Kineosporia mesophila TaxID=566012 RepID=A0ABP6ZJF2_9ACTN|nr:anti-sigma factor [Kineosporia mesophila]MCD5349665.1 anti-sigma factor [Kineosporia mesophila]
MPDLHDLHTLSAAYALDALDDLERRAFERHLHDCESCSLEVREFSEATASLAARVAEPAPARLHSAVMSEIGRTRQLSSSSGRPARRFGQGRLLAGAAAVLLVIAGVAGLGGTAWREHRLAQEARTTAAGITRVLTDPDRIETTREVSGGGRATMVMADGGAVLSTRGVPDAPSGHEYQMWVMRDGTVQSGGILSVQDGDGSAFMTGLSTDVRLAVSVEPAGGSERPTTTPVVELGAS